MQSTVSSTATGGQHRKGKMELKFEADLLEAGTVLRQGQEQPTLKQSHVYPGYKQNSHRRIIKSKGTRFFEQLKLHRAVFRLPLVQHLSENFSL